MASVLIIDDEARQVKSLKKIIEKYRPDFKIFEAYNGQQGWDTVNNSDIDVVITDIRMPIMNGMDLINRIAKMKPDIKMVLLSGYGQFNYAQGALKCGVIDYLVKPIGKEDIIQIINKIEKILIKESKQDKSGLIYQNHLLNSLISGKIIAEEQAELLNMIPQDGPGIVVSVHIEKIENDAILDSKAEWFEHSFMKGLSSLGSCFVFNQEREDKELVGLVFLHSHLQEKKHDISSKLRRVLEDIQSKSHNKVVFGVSFVSNMLCEQAEASYNDAVLALKHKFYLCDEKVIWRSKVNLFKDTFELLSQKTNFLEAIQSKDWQKVSDLVKKMFTISGLDGYPDPDQLKLETIQFLILIVQELKSFIPEKVFMEYPSNIKRRLNACEEFLELRYCTKEFLLEFIDIVDRLQQQDKNLVVIQKCQEYMQENYWEDLSLDFLAKLFHFNPSYFSNLFKSKAGIGFSEYLLHIRIQQAKSLLVSSNKKISDIARQVGFRDAAYFNKLFKRATGVSPNSFRRMTGNE